MKNTRIMALFVVALMTLSIVPAVFAQGDYQARGQAGLRAASQEWQALNAQYDIYKADYTAKKNDIKQLKEDIKKRGNMNAGDIPMVQDYFHTALNLAVAHGERVVALLETTSLSNKDTYISTLNGYGRSLNAMHTDVDAASTRAEFNAIGTKIRNEWNEMRTEVRKATCELSTERIGIAIDAAEDWYTKAEALVAEAEAAGKNVGRQQNALIEAQADLDKARASAQDSKASCQTSGSAQGFDAAAKEANRHRNTAVNYIKSVASALNNLVN